MVIIGGGMVGAAMARALRTSKFKVALIDASPESQLTQDHRLIALNYSSICLLKNLNIWPALSAHAAPIEKVHVSHRGHFGISHICASDLNLSALGYVIPAKYINAALYQNFENISLIRPATLKKLSQDKDTATLTIQTPDGEQELSAKIVIGADGTRSTVRELLNISTEKKEYHQSALVTTTQLHRSHHNIAYERFQNDGAIAMLPLSENSVATIWTDSNENISQLMQLSDDAFLEKLQKHFGYRLGKLQSISQRFTYPLQMIQATTKITERTILIGNAAHTLHPIAAQGLNLALYEIAELAEYFNQHDLEKISLQDLAAQQQKISVGLSHNLTWIFSQDFFLANAARKIGMIGLDLIKPLKERFARRAIGQSGKVPALLREKEFHDELNN